MTSKVALDRLIDAKILLCPLCRSPMNRARDGVFLCETGHELFKKHGVLDLYVAPSIQQERSGDDDEQSALVAALADRLGLKNDDLAAAELFQPLPTTGNAFFDAEEEIFLDRFAFSNIRPRLTVQKIYSNGKMQAAAVNWLAVRVRNDSLFPITSTGGNPVLLAYHWFDANGALLCFEGRRTPLPVDVKPGQALTVHVAVETPNEVQRLSLHIVPVHELVSWLEEDGGKVDIEITSDAPPSLPRYDRDRPFSETLDDELSLEFLDRHLASTPGPILGLEIGGGIMSALSKWIWGRSKTATVINGDVSVRLLRIAALLSAKGADPVTVHARFDANNMPIQSNALDAAIFCRSLHHFEDPVVVMRECYRVLKPGGFLFLLCEPVATQYDEPTKALIRAGVNEQMFPFAAYEAMIKDACFTFVDAECDWGFSLKAALRKPD